MAEFRKGVALIKETAEAKGGGKMRFTPNIYWKNGDIRTLLFITPAEDIPKVRLHQMVRIPDDSREKGIRFETFLCHKDPSIGAGTCELCDRIGHKAEEKFVALAIELEQIKEGKRTVGLKVKSVTKTRDDGTEVDYPRWGLVTQGAKNFFAWLAAYDENKGDITEKAFEIHREGDSIGTKYHFFPEDAALPSLDEVLDEIPSLDELLEKMGAEDKYAELTVVEAGSQPSFGDDKKQTPSQASAPTDRAAAFNRIKSQVEGY